MCWMCCFMCSTAIFCGVAGERDSTQSWYRPLRVCGTGLSWTPDHLAEERPNASLERTHQNVQQVLTQPTWKILSDRGGAPVELGHICFGLDVCFGPTDDAQTGFRTLTLFRAWIASLVSWKLCLTELFMSQFLQRNKRRLIIQRFTNRVLLDFLFDFLLMSSPVWFCYGILKGKADLGVVKEI